MKISIIIPVYNVEPYIADCLQSVFKQSYSDIELIIIDDCGSDQSMKIAQALVEEYVGNIRIQIYAHSSNKGLSAARNTGLLHATGDYVYFLDSDDVLPVDAIEKLVSQVRLHNQVDFVIGGIKTFGCSIYEYPLLSDDYVCGNKLILEYFLLKKWNEMACNKLINREFLKRKNLSFLEGVYHEDLDFSFNLALNAETMAVCHDVTYNYMTRENSITTKRKLKNYQDECFIFLNNMERITHFKDESGHYLQLRNLYIVNACCSFTFNLIKEKNPDISWKEKEALLTKFTGVLDNFKLTTPFVFKIYLKIIFLRLPYCIQRLVVKCFLS